MLHCTSTVILAEEESVEAHCRMGSTQRINTKQNCRLGKPRSQEQT